SAPWAVLSARFCPCWSSFPRWVRLIPFSFFQASSIARPLLAWLQQPTQAIRTLWMPVVIGVLSALALTGPLRAPAPNATLLYEDDSAYNYIQVQEDANGYRYLYLNEG